MEIYLPPDVSDEVLIAVLHRLLDHYKESEQIYRAQGMLGYHVTRNILFTHISPHLMESDRSKPSTEATD